jgi:hypothetical protein
MMIYLDCSRLILVDACILGMDLPPLGVFHVITGLNVKRHRRSCYSICPSVSLFDSPFIISLLLLLLYLHTT